jgi:hypothetical protein
MAVGKSYLLRAVFAASGTRFLRDCRPALDNELLPRYVELCDKVVQLHEKNSISRKRKKLNPPIFEKRLRQVALAERTEKMVLFNEALMQSALAYSLAVGNDLDLVREFVDILPLPDFAICCLAPKKIILERCAERAKQGGPDRSANTLDLVAPTSVIMGVLLNRGVDCMSVDTSRPIDELVKDVTERLQKYV